jgi:teichuronic acid biosynthesis glycosyltransferase TuaG
MINDENLKLISIITPSYNAMKFIEETYMSILNQTYSQWEWMITDDCSSDGTWEYLCALALQDSRIKPIRNSENSGAAVSRNKSIERAKGDFIAFLDSDDIWMPEKLALHIDFMEQQHANISFTPYALIDENSADLNQEVDVNKKGSFSYQDMLIKKATMGCCTVIVRVAVFSDLSMPLIRAGQDYALWLKLLKTDQQAIIFPQVLSRYRIVSNSLSRNKIKKAYKIWQVYRDIEKLNVFKALYVFSHYAIRAFFKLN